MRSRLSAALLAWAIAAPSLAQAPLPFPGATAPPGEAVRPPRAVAQPAPAAIVPAGQAPVVPAGGSGGNGPAAATVVFPIVPDSQFLGSYNAGKGQRYYLYGTTKPYLDVVAYYRTQLKDRGDEVFAEPATHMFQDKFRPEAMAFPPGVTVKDWTYQSKGYPNPLVGGKPERFPTIVMIVPRLPSTPPAP